MRARKALIVATGGSSGNVNFRRMFDPRLTEEYQVAGEAVFIAGRERELAAMAIGASLWGTANQTLRRNGALRKRPVISAQHIYPEWTPQSRYSRLSGPPGSRCTTGRT